MDAKTESIDELVERKDLIKETLSVYFQTGLTPSQLLARVRELELELERERIRLAACGVVANSNTPETAARNREMHPDYMSASCQDVMRVVDSEMALRDRVRELEAMVTPRPIELAPMSTALEVHTLLLWVDRFGWQKGNVADLGDGDLLFNINNFSGGGWSARFFLPLPPPPKDSL